MSLRIKGKLKRQIRVYGISEPVNLYLSENGIAVALPGFKIKLIGSWDSVIRGLHTPSNAPAYLDGKPMDFLKFQERKLRKKKEAAMYRASSV